MEDWEREEYEYESVETRKAACKAAGIDYSSDVAVVEERLAEVGEDEARAFWRVIFARANDLARCAEAEALEAYRLSDLAEDLGF